MRTTSRTVFGRTPRDMRNYTAPQPFDYACVALLLLGSRQGKLRNGQRLHRQLALQYALKTMFILFHADQRTQWPLWVSFVHFARSFFLALPDLVRTDAPLAPLVAIFAAVAFFISSFIFKVCWLFL